MKVTYTARSQNPKTGNIPTAWVGETHEERYKSCEGCKLRDTSCYAWRGPTHLGSISTAKSNKDKSIETAIANSIRTAKAIRFTALGDIGGKNVDHNQLEHDFQKINEAGLKKLAYTHFWKRKRNQWLKEHVRASCNNWKEAEQALAMGWKVAVISEKQLKGEKYSDFETHVNSKNNNKLIGRTCDYYLKNVNCNSCLECADFSNDIIVFPKIGKKNGKKDNKSNSS